MILMHYTLDRPDHAHFLPASGFLATLGVLVPRVLQADESLQLVWLEDLGCEDLWTLRDQPWEVLAARYRAALVEAAKLHALAECPVDCPLQPPFDAALYRWEQEYFVRNFLEGCCGIEPDHASTLFSHPDFVALAEHLASLPRYLVHRDLQSQNVMVRGTATYLIDYQGIRWGRPEYDLASLLLDPYVDLTPLMRDELLDFYLENFMPSTDPERFRQVYLACAAQRLMQALGAYGYLAHTAGKRYYLEFVPVAAQRLAEVLKSAGFLEVLLRLLSPARIRPAM
jgi:aminoglycoside/choline kinase family phosphotransferase